MRDPNRLDTFYEEIKQLHKSVVPDWRFGQMMINFERWYLNKKGNDTFFLEENDYLEMFKQFMKGDY